MKNKKLLFMLPLLGALLSGCVGQNHYEAPAYSTSIRWNADKSEYKILQLGDIHLSQSDIYEEHFKVIRKTIETANPDLIVLNGDSFTFADKSVVNRLFTFMDMFKISWTFTYGNHDDQGYYDDMYINRLLGSHKYQHCVFKNIEDDDVTGRTNFVIKIDDKHLGSGSSTPAYLVYILDSHSYNFDTGAYDFVKQDQIDWLARMADYYKDGDNYIPGAVYMHIGTPEFYEAAHKAEENDPNVKLKLGSTDEWEGGPTPESDKGFFEAARTHGVKSIHASHEHINDSVIEFKGVNLCFGVHSTDRIYNDMKKIGGQLLTIDYATKSEKYTNIYVDTLSEDLTVNLVEEAK